MLANYRSGDIIIAANNGDINANIFAVREGKITDSPEIEIPAGGFIYAINAGNDYPSLGVAAPDYTSPSCSMMWQRINDWKIGQRFLFNNVNIASGEIPTTTPLVKWYDDGYICTATYDILKEQEHVTIDGYFDEDAWAYGGWLSGEAACGGTYQNSETIPDDVDLTYKYKFITDDNFIYGAFVNNLTPNNNDNAPSIFRIWIRSNPEA
jgi:hypothetical protein